ncbi:hypothetical protein F2Q68_00031308 [Brassica cretica]|uniref:Uncharacterized protein n=1 Tax=Brassica cretica TaxID=69181 RepID=A0A8S9GEG6_BRACR|nr:hypothetical protein F2Q68_00031308 [Brassica cretica]
MICFADYLFDDDALNLHKGKLIDHLSSVLQRLELHQRQLKAELSSVLFHDEASTKGVSFTSLLELSSAVKSLAYDHSLGWKRDALKLHKGQLLGDLSSVFQRLELQRMLQLVTAAVVIPLSFTSLFTAQDSFQSPLSSVFKLGLGHVIKGSWESRGRRQQDAQSHVKLQINQVLRAFTHPQHVSSCFHQSMNNSRLSSRDKHFPLYKQSRDDEEYETLFANDGDLVTVLTTLLATSSSLITNSTAQAGTFLNIIIA